MTVYGLSGASGSGKTTLARMVADQLDITYLPTSISECARRHGFDAVGDLSLPERVDLQLLLLRDHLELLEATKGPIITDRTPVDMVAYMMCEFDMHSHQEAPAELLEVADHYVTQCQRAVKAHYDHVFLLSRLLRFEVAETRPAANPAYHRNTDLVMKGCLLDLSQQIRYSVVAGQALDFRVEFVTGTIAKRLDMLEERRRASAHLH